MRTVGIFEAKTKFSEICQLVAQTGQAIRVTRRGKPMVVINPPEPEKRRESVWAARDRFERESGPLTEDLQIPARRVSKRTLRNPLD